jgi:hypothetical protein
MSKLVPLMVRLPEELHAQIKTLAEREYRSLNAQIIVLLRRALEDEQEAHDVDDLEYEPA